MQQFIIIAAAAVAVFALFLCVMALKEKRAAAKPPIHTCVNRGGCQCKPDSGETTLSQNGMPHRPCSPKADGHTAP